MKKQKVVGGLVKEKKKGGGREGEKRHGGYSNLGCVECVYCAKIKERSKERGGGGVPKKKGREKPHCSLFCLHAEFFRPESGRKKREGGRRPDNSSPSPPGRPQHRKKGGGEEKKHDAVCRCVQ